MFNWLRRRRLSPESRKRLLLVAARSEEALVRTHVSNLLDLIDTLGDEVELDRAFEIYIEMVDLDEARAQNVINRLLATLESRAAAPSGRTRFRNIFRQNDRA